MTRRTMAREIAVVAPAAVTMKMKVRRSSLRERKRSESDQVKNN